MGLIKNVVLTVGKIISMGVILSLIIMVSSIGIVM